MDIKFVVAVSVMLLGLGSELNSQEIENPPFILHVGLGIDPPEGVNDAILYYKAGIGKMGSRYIMERAYFHYGLTLGFVQRKVSDDNSVVERRSYLASPRFDLRFDQIFPKGELYFGLQTKMGVTQSRSSDPNQVPTPAQFFFELDESLFFGGCYDVSENGSIYAEYGGLGRVGFGFRYLIRP